MSHLHNNIKTAVLHSELMKLLHIPLVKIQIWIGEAKLLHVVANIALCLFNLAVLQIEKDVNSNGVQLE